MSVDFIGQDCAKLKRQLSEKQCSADIFGHEDFTALLEIELRRRELEIFIYDNALRRETNIITMQGLHELRTINVALELLRSSGKYARIENSK